MSKTAHAETDEESVTNRHQDRFEFVRAHKLGESHEIDETMRAIFSNASECVQDIDRHTFSPQGPASGKYRHVYEIRLREDVDEIVPTGVAEGAAFFDLDVTATKTGEDGQRLLLLEPEDTERWPRTA